MINVTTYSLTIYSLIAFFMNALVAVYMLSFIPVCIGVTKRASGDKGKTSLIFIIAGAVLCLLPTLLTVVLSLVRRLVTFDGGADVVPGIIDMIFTFGERVLMIAGCLLLFVGISRKMQGTVGNFSVLMIAGGGVLLVLCGFISPIGHQLVNSLFRPIGGIVSFITITYLALRMLSFVLHAASLICLCVGVGTGTAPEKKTLRTVMYCVCGGLMLISVIVYFVPTFIQWT